MNQTSDLAQFLQAVAHNEPGGRPASYPQWVVPAALYADRLGDAGVTTYPDGRPNLGPDPLSYAAVGAISRVALDTPNEERIAGLWRDLVTDLAFQAGWEALRDWPIEIAASLNATYLDRAGTPISAFYSYQVAFRLALTLPRTAPVEAGAW